MISLQDNIYVMDADNGNRTCLLAQMEMGGIYYNQVENIEQAFDNHLSYVQALSKKDYEHLFTIEL